MEGFLNLMFGYFGGWGRQALGFAHPPNIGFLTNQLLGILPTDGLVLGFCFTVLVLGFSFRVWF